MEGKVRSFYPFSQRNNSIEEERNFTMEQWDKDQISSIYRFRAQDAENYCKEIKEKIKFNPNYEFLYDEHLAKSCVYGYLYGKLFLASRDQLLDELLRMPSYEVRPIDCYVLDRFERFRLRYINEVIAELKKT